MWVLGGSFMQQAHTHGEDDPRGRYSHIPRPVHLLQSTITMPDATPSGFLSLWGTFRAVADDKDAIH